MKSLPKDNTMMEEEDDVMDEIDDSDLDAFIPEEVAGKDGGEENDDHSEEESDESEDEELNEKNSKESKVEQNLKDAEEQEDKDDVEEADEDEEEEVEENSSPRRSSRFNPNTSEADKNVEEQTEEGRVEEEKEPLRRSSRLSIPTCESESVEKEKEEVEVIHLDEEEKPEERDEEVKDGSNEEKDKEMKERKDKSEEGVEEQIINLARMVKDKKQEEMVLMEAKGELNSSEEGEEIKEISMVDKDQVMEEEADKDEEMDDIDDSDLDAFLPNNEKADPKTNEDVENEEINTKKMAEVEGTANDSESNYEEIMEDVPAKGHLKLVAEEKPTVDQMKKLIFVSPATSLPTSTSVEVKSSSGSAVSLSLLDDPKGGRKGRTMNSKADPQKPKVLDEGHARRSSRRLSTISSRLTDSPIYQVGVAAQEVREANKDVEAEHSPLKNIKELKMGKVIKSDGEVVKEIRFRKKKGSQEVLASPKMTPKRKHNIVDEIIPKSSGKRPKNCLFGEDCLGCKTPECEECVMCLDR